MLLWLLLVTGLVCLPRVTSTGETIAPAVELTGGFGYELLLLKLDDLENRIRSLEQTVTDLQGTNKQLQHELHSLQMRVQNVPFNSADSYRSCKDVVDRPSGLYNIWLGYGNITSVLCDNDFDNGGWTVIQHRFNGTEDFYRGWNDYKNGFGVPGSEFWFGLDRIQQITSAAHHELVFLLEDLAGNELHARYNRFNISGEGQNYTVLQLGYFSGTADNSIGNVLGMPFSTFDNDNDKFHDNNCATLYRGAWWYDNCLQSNLNGEYSEEKARHSLGMVWFTSKGYTRMKSSKMMIRKIQLPEQ